LEFVQAETDVNTRLKEAPKEKLLFEYPFFYLGFNSPLNQRSNLIRT
jgi:hypothetical protein